MARRFGESYPRPLQMIVRGGKIIGFEEKADPPAELVADCGTLRVVACLGEQEAASVLAANDQPALAAAQIGVLDQIEAQHPGEELQGFVVIGDDQSDEGKAGRGHWRSMSRPTIIRMTWFVPSRIECTRRSRQKRSIGYSLR